MAADVKQNDHNWDDILYQLQHEQDPYVRHLLNDTVNMSPYKNYMTPGEIAGEVGAENGSLVRQILLINDCDSFKMYWIDDDDLGQFLSHCARQIGYKINAKEKIVSKLKNIVSKLNVNGRTKWEMIAVRAAHEINSKVSERIRVMIRNLEKALMANGGDPEFEDLRMVRTFLWKFNRNWDDNKYEQFIAALDEGAKVKLSHQEIQCIISLIQRVTSTDGWRTDVLTPPSQS